MTHDQLRIIDANLNRLGEGLRVLEEFARMTLNDTVLTQKLKDLRHKTVVVKPEFQKLLLIARDSANDVGSDMDVKGEGKGKDVLRIIVANAKRAQESLRVMEELNKIPELERESEIYRQARFELYEIEKELISKLSRREKLDKLVGIYAVVDTEWLKGRQPGKVAEQMIKGGAKVVQLRAKNLSGRDFLAIAKELKEICHKKNVLFIVNDSLEVALAVGADGLHVGQEDLPAKGARRLMPVDMILGCSVSSVKEAINAKNDGADYLGVGAVFATATKESAKAVGLKRIGDIKKAVDLPLVAIGGISKDNLADVIKAGADSAAVISAILGAENIEKATKELVNIIRGVKK